jgi:O-antigen ligase
MDAVTESNSTARLSTPGKVAGALGVGFGFFAGVGVTGLSMLVGLLGIWMLYYGVTTPRRPLFSAFKKGLLKNTLAWTTLAAFVIWVLVSALWSPATILAGESVRRLTAVSILMPAAIWAIASAGRTDQPVVVRGLLAGLVISASFLLFETLSDAAINKIASPEKDPLAIGGDLGRAATATISLAWAGFACLRIHYPTRFVSFLFVGVFALLSLQFGTDLNALGLALGTLAALVALWFPRVAISCLTGACAILMMSAPLIYPLITKVMILIAPGGKLPLSYGRRVQMWQVASDLIAQKPLTGWGLGAGSTFDRTISYGGYEWPLIQLHPHAAPLHIWLETGGIGALLASITIIAAGGAALSAFRRSPVAASALVGGLTFLALQWGFSHAAWREWMWCSFGALIGFSLALRHLERPRRPLEFDAE